MAKRSSDDLLDRNEFLIKEQVAMLRRYDVYDIFDPETGDQIGRATEKISGFTAFLRWFVSKKLMSIHVEVTDANENIVFTIRKPFAFFREKVEVYDAKDKMIGYFKSKIFSLGGGFYVYDSRDRQVAEIKGKWTGWEFKFIDKDGGEVGQVTKKWAGLAKELFSSADNYVVSIDESMSDDMDAKCLLLAAALAIDVIYYEQAG